MFELHSAERCTCRVGRHIHCWKGKNFKRRSLRRWFVASQTVWKTTLVQYPSIHTHQWCRNIQRTYLKNVKFYVVRWGVFKFLNHSRSVYVQDQGCPTSFPWRTNSKDLKTKTSCVSLSARISKRFYCYYFIFPNLKKAGCILYNDVYWVFTFLLNFIFHLFSWVCFFFSNDICWSNWNVWPQKVIPGSYETSQTNVYCRSPLRWSGPTNECLNLL